MTEPSRAARPTMVPCFGYRDAVAALRWLAEAFGFEERQAYAAPDGTVMHAEMAFGGDVVMIGTGEPPAEGDAAATAPTGHGIYVVVEDVDAHHERAKAAGARIVYGPEDTAFGTRRYRALDPEGYEWSFGTYSPSAL
jgi:uncharacterized glyoxalase superfamily protein PhnB